MILNLVDVDNVAWVRPEIIDAAIEAIEANLAEGRPVLVHCNQGVSRSPSIALLWMVQHTSTFDECMSIDDALFQFRHTCPSYYPRARHGRLRAGELGSGLVHQGEE